MFLGALFRFVWCRSLYSSWVGIFVCCGSETVLWWPSLAYYSPGWVASCGVLYCILTFLAFVYLPGVRWCFVGGKLILYVRGLLVVSSLDCCGVCFLILNIYVFDLLPRVCADMMGMLLL